MVDGLVAAVLVGDLTSRAVQQVVHRCAHGRADVLGEQVNLLVGRQTADAIGRCGERREAGGVAPLALARDLALANVLEDGQRGGYLNRKIKSIIFSFLSEFLMNRFLLKR